MSLEQLEIICGELRALRDIPPASLAETRANFERYAVRFPLDSDIRAEDQRVAGVPVQALTPDGADPARQLLYFHGGGYIIGSSATHRALVGRLARAAAATAVVPDYRLAPEHPHPAPLEDALRVYRALLAEGIRPEDLVVAGDSAGGGLALSMLVAAKGEGMPMPAAALCLSPWVDLEATGASVSRCADSDPVVAPRHIRSFARMFIGDGDLRDPGAAPLHADLRGLPPLLIQVGDNETLLDDSIRIAKRAADGGVETTLRIWPGMFHVWHLFASELDEGYEAIEEGGRFLGEHLAKGDVTAIG